VPPPSLTRPIRVQDLYRVVLLAFGLIVAMLIAQELLTIILGVVVAALLAVPLAAAADRLHRRLRVPHVLGVLLTLVAVIALWGGLLAVIVPTLVDQAGQLVDQVPSTVEDLQGRLRDLTGIDSRSAGAAVEGFLRSFERDPDRLLGPVTDVGITILGAVAAGVIILINAVFMAVNPRPLINGFLALFPRDQREPLRRILGRVRSAWLGWMVGVVIDGLCLLLLTYAGLSLIGLPFALAFAVLSALLTVIPNYGSVISAIPPILFGLQDSPQMAALVLLVYVAIGQFEGNVIYPVIMSRAVNLHPAVVAIGVTVAATLFGVVGLFIAIPLISLLFITVDELRVRPLAAREAAASAPESPTTSTPA